MGVNPVETEARPARSAPAPRTGRTPEPETRARFEDALDRREKGAKGKDGQAERGESLVQGDASGQMAQGRGLDFMQDDGRGSQKGRHPIELTAPADAPPLPTASAPVAAAPAPVEVTAPQAPATLASSYAEFAARIDLPTTIVGAETQVTMSDQRWLASQAVVASDGKGGLTLDVETRGDGDAERQREALRARLEARGHRIEGVTFKSA